MARKVFNIASILLLCGILLFMVFATPHLLGSVGKDILGNELAKRREQNFHGVINVWQIDSFEGGVGSRTAWLNRRLTELEKKYVGIYFVVKSVSVELLPQLLQHSKPDLISFGGGVFTPAQASELLLPIASPNTLVPSLVASCQGLAVPMFFGGYCLLTGTEFASRMDPNEDLAGYLNMPCGTITYNKNKVPVQQLCVNYANTGVAALAGLIGPNLSFSVFTATSDDLWDSYNYNKTSATALCSQRQLYRLTAAAARNKMRPSTVLPLPGYTDMVQSIGIPKGVDNKKLEVLYQVIAYLCSTPVQMKLNEIGLLPCDLSALGSIQYENEYMQILAEGIRAHTINAPSLFMSMEEQLDAVDPIIQYLTGQSDSFYMDFAAGLYK